MVAHTTLLELIFYSSILFCGCHAAVHQNSNISFHESSPGNQICVRSPVQLLKSMVENPSENQIYALLISNEVDSSSCLLLQQVQRRFQQPGVIISWIKESPEDFHKQGSMSQILQVEHQPTFVIFKRKHKIGRYKAHIFAKYERNEIDTDRIVVDLQALCGTNIKHLTETTLVNAITPRSKFRPVLILFYSFWAPGVSNYLAAFLTAAEEFAAFNTTTRFAIIDLHQHDVLNHLSGFSPTKFPFLLYFHPVFRRSRVEKVGRIEISVYLPTPLTLFNELQRLGYPLQSTDNIPLLYQPWGASHGQFSVLSEGPYGTHCTSMSHNTTENDPILPKPKEKRVYIPKRAPATVNLFSKRPIELDALQSKLPVAESGIPFLGKSAWTNIMERSHSELHPFSKPLHSIGDHVSVVIFITQDCDFCKKSMAVFAEIWKQCKKHYEEVSVYLVECQEEKHLCSQQEVTGYPTVIGYRHIDWNQHKECLSENTVKKLKFSRHDYHGLIRIHDIREWIRWLISPVVSVEREDSGYDERSSYKQSNDATLIATLAPRGSRFLPVKQTVKSGGNRLAYECFQLICHRLLGFVDCQAIYHNHLSDSDLLHYKLSDMVVIQIKLDRTDGMITDVMQSLRPFSNLMEAESGNSIHKLHPPHRYRLAVKQTCEDNLAHCVDHVVQYTLDHARLAISTLTTHTFHSHQGLVGDRSLPVLIVLTQPSNFTATSNPHQIMKDVAVKFYTQVRVMSVNINQYSHWANRIVPKDYSADYHSRDEDAFNDLYPRLAMIEWIDHSHAAFYPSGTLFRKSSHFNYTIKGVSEFIEKYLRKPKMLIEETETF